MLSIRAGVAMAVIINGITCPFTVLLNVLVIMAVKRRPRLRSKANILLACLAATDAATGLTAQLTFILWFSLQLLAQGAHTNCVTVCSLKIIRECMGKTERFLIT